MDCLPLKKQQTDGFVKAMLLFVASENLCVEAEYSVASAPAQQIVLGKISDANFLSVFQLSAKSELCLSVVLEKRSALEHAVAVAWSRPHKAVALRRPIAKSRER